jgi:xanthine dehydrogenase accessory factor
MTDKDAALVLVRGGGDLASGVALRLSRAGIKVLITELEQPLAVRRTVSFGEAVYEAVHTVEGITARRVESSQVFAALDSNEIPVLVDPDANILLSAFHFPVVVDSRLLKAIPEPLPLDVPLHIGLGPGFHAGINCDAVIETRRSHTLGRVYWEGATQPDSGQPEGDPRRVLRAPMDGHVVGLKDIGEHVEEGEALALVQHHVTQDGRHSHLNAGNLSPVTQSYVTIFSPLKGVLRGLIHPSVYIPKGVKVGDVDPRDDASACFLVSDKALAIGGGALEAILTRREIRENLWD